MRTFLVLGKELGNALRIIKRGVSMPFFALPGMTNVESQCSQGEAPIFPVIWHKDRKFSFKSRSNKLFPKLSRLKLLRHMCELDVCPFCCLDLHQVSSHMSPPSGSSCGCSSSLVQIAKVEVAARNDPHPDNNQARLRVWAKAKVKWNCPFPTLAHVYRLKKHFFFFNESGRRTCLCTFDCGHVSFQQNTNALCRVYWAAVTNVTWSQFLIKNCSKINDILLSWKI